MNITKNSIYLTKFNDFADYVPVLSTVTAIVDLALKAFLHFAGPETVKKSAYFEHIKDKSIERCVFLLVPVLGNVVVAISDKFMKGRGVSFWNNRNDEVSRDYNLEYHMLMEGAHAGNTDCMNALGDLYERGGDGISANRNTSIDYYARAARRGNGYAIHKLHLLAEEGSLEKARLLELTRLFPQNVE